MQYKMRFNINRISDHIPAPRNSSHNSLTTLVSQSTSYKARSRHLSNLRQFARVDNVCDWFTSNLRNYCQTTSLHGFNYITRNGNTSSERSFWITVVVLSMIVSIILVVYSWFWNRETPTVTVIESSHYATWNIPFPAVTICSFNKISKTKAVQLASSIKHSANISQEELLELFHITLYFSVALNHTEVDVGLFESILNDNNLTLSQLTERLSPDCMDMISRCLWKGTNVRCDSLFQRIVSIEGVCCSFNYFGMATNNFPQKIAYQISKRPYRVTGCGYSTGLSVMLNPIAEDYFGTYFSSYGFRLLIHDAYNFPDENAETKVVTASRESFVRINPESTYATGDIRKMDVSLRGCLFPNERRLAIMQHYSFINCMWECRVMILYKKCGCVPVNLPSNGSFPTCGALQIQCIIENREIFTRALPNLQNTLSIVQDTKSFPCDCLPDCEGNQYPSEITMGRLNVNLGRNINVNNTGDPPIRNEQILLHVFFSDLLSTRYRMEIFQNWLSALASFGGLLGLIMGFSIVTAFEFFYFLTFRPVFNYLNHN